MTKFSDAEVYITVLTNLTSFQTVNLVYEPC